MLTIEERRQKVIDLIGYGNPNSKVLFCGKNEGDGWYNESDIITDASLSSLKTPYTIDIDIRTYHGGTAYYGYKYILQNINYHKEDLARNDYFVTNIWPFGKEKKGYGPFGKDIDYFGFKFNDEITEVILNNRFRKLKCFFELFHWTERYIYLCIGSNDLFISWVNKFLNDYLNIEPNWKKHSANTSFLENYNIFLLPHGCSFNKIGSDVIRDLIEIDDIKRNL
jgi:hypothetical protein